MPLEEGAKRPLPPSCPARSQLESSIQKPGRGPSPGTNAPGVRPPELSEINVGEATPWQQTGTSAIRAGQLRFSTTLRAEEVMSGLGVNQHKSYKDGGFGSDL